MTWCDAGAAGAVASKQKITLQIDMKTPYVVSNSDMDTRYSA